MSLDTKGTAVSLAFQDGSCRFILQRVGPSQPTLIELIRKTYPGAYYEKLPEAFSLVGETDSDSVIKSSSNFNKLFGYKICCDFSLPTCI